MSELCRRLAGPFVLAAIQICFATPVTTPIRDVLYNADGTPLSGLVVITWPAFTAADGTTVPASSMNVAVSNGSFQANLIPTANAQTAVTYSVEIISNGANQTAETWNVPPSTTPLTIAVVLVSSTSPGGITMPLGGSTTVTIGNVQGLANELSTRPVMGAGYTASRTAVIDSTGAISAAAGDPSDCVRVDGSSTPCGSGSGTSASFVDAEVPGGVVDGANAQFSLSQSPGPAASLMLARNGLVLQQGSDYSLTGSTVIFQAAAVPQAGDILQASYRVSGSSGSDGSTFTGNAIGNLSTLPAPGKIVTSGHATQNNAMVTAFCMGTIGTGSSTVYYLAPAASSATCNASSPGAGQPMAYACTARNLYVRVGANSHHSGSVLRIIKNGATAVLSCNIPTSGNVCSDTSGAGKFSAGDYWYADVTTSSNGNDGTAQIRASFQCQ